MFDRMYWSETERWDANKRPPEESHLMLDAPLVYQLHAIGGFLFLALWPFTRLVHVWSAPPAYLWRPYVVYRARRGAPPAPAPAPAMVRDRLVAERSVQS